MPGFLERLALHYHKPALRVTLVYLVFTGLWILFFDAIVSHVVSPETFVTISVFEDWLLSLIVAMILYRLIKNYFAELEASRRKAAESEQHLLLIIDSIPALVSYVDSTCRYTWVNRGYQELFGKDGGTITGRSVRDVLGEAAWETVRPYIERVLAGEQVSFEIEIPDRTGGLRTHRPTYTPLHDSDGEVRGFVAMVYDITTQKAAEQSLRRYGQRLVDLEEEVRKQLAAELHDEMGPDLTALNFDLALIRQSSDPGKSLDEPLSDAEQLVNDLSGKVRNIIARLHPPVLHDYGLEAALRWYAGQMMKRTGVTVSIVTRGTVPRLPKDHELALYSITKEALSNASKYSGGDTITVTFGCSGGCFRLSVVDKGRGFEQNAVSPGCWGLTIMQERTRMMGGAFRLETAPGTGTAIYLEIPMEKTHASYSTDCR